MQVMTNSYRDDVPFFFSTDQLAQNIKSRIGYSFERFPMTLVIGSTGSGKTTAVAYMCAMLSKYWGSSMRLNICDYKNLDYSQYKGLYRHFGYTAVEDGLRMYYDEFSARLRGETKELAPTVLMFDEWGAFLSSLEKKQADEMRSKVAEIMFLGRAYRCYCIFSLQRGDSEHFKSGSRDQFMAILAMGNLSKEQKQMFFSEYKDEMSVCQRGQGHLYLDGKGFLQRVTVPTVTPDGMKQMEAYIRKALT